MSYLVPLIELVAEGAVVALRSAIPAAVGAALPASVSLIKVVVENAQSKKLAAETAFNEALGSDFVRTAAGGRYYRALVFRRGKFARFDNQ